MADTFGDIRFDCTEVCGLTLWRYAFLLCGDMRSCRTKDCVGSRIRGINEYWLRCSIGVCRTFIVLYGLL